MSKGSGGNLVRLAIFEVRGGRGSPFLAEAFAVVPTRRKRLSLALRDLEVGGGIEPLIYLTLWTTSLAAGTALIQRRGWIRCAAGDLWTIRERLDAFRSDRHRWDRLLQTEIVRILAESLPSGFRFHVKKVSKRPVLQT